MVLLWVGFKKDGWKNIADLLFQQLGVDDADLAMPSSGELGRIIRRIPKQQWLDNRSDRHHESTSADAHVRMERATYKIWHRGTFIGVRHR